MSVNEYRRAPINRGNTDVTPSKWSHKVLRRYQLSHKLLYRLWRERPSLPRRIASLSVWQESLCRPSVTDQRRKYSLEGTRIIPRGRHESYFVLKNLNNLRRIYNSLLIPNPERSPPVHIRVICSQWSPIKNCDDVEKNIHTRLGIINTGSEVLMPDPKLFCFPNCSKNLFI